MQLLQASAVGTTCYSQNGKVMNNGHLKPVTAAELALRVYAVNENNPDDIKSFLMQPIFRKGSSKVLVARVGGHILRAAKDSFGVIAFGAEKTPFANDLFLIFRGTTTANKNADWITDARIGVTTSAKGKPVHIGFNDTFNSMRKQISAFVAGEKFSGRVHCIGHSLGGAVATLAADWCKPHISDEVILYTFGSPRVGLSIFSASTTRKLGKENIHRTFNTTDPVPMVPIFPYNHLPFMSYGHRLDSDDLITSGEAHSMKKYVHKLRSLGVGNWLGVPREKAIFNHRSAIDEWLDSRRDENPEDSRTFAKLETAIRLFLRQKLKRAIEDTHLIIMGVHTFIDYLAKELHRAAMLIDETSELVKRLMRKIMRVLGIPQKLLEQHTTLQFYTYVLRLLVRRANERARKAIRGI